VVDAGRRPAGLVAARVATGAGYAAQGLGYATVVTSLPLLKERQGIDDAVVSGVVLTVCLAAAAGSVVADRVAARRGSRAALVVGLLVQAAALPAVVARPTLALFVAAFAVYGVGLGMVDAATGMQGVQVQRRYGRPVMSGFFACYTAAAIAGALLVSAVARHPSAAVVALIAAAGWLAATAAAVARHLVAREPDGTATGTASGTASDAGPGVVAAEVGLAADAPADAIADLAAERRPPLPARGVWTIGAVVMAAFVADSAVSTWSTVYLHDALGASASVAPLGYAAYQAAILVSRAVGDRAVGRLGRGRLAVISTLVSVAGLALVALAHTPSATVLGFAAAGVGVGVLVPVAFSAAGELVPSRSDEVVARVNLFNYAGAVLGAVVVGLFSSGPGLGVGFLVPLALLLPILRVRRTLDAHAAAS
jgi:predicted MFS family arabinose efflux permease